MSAGLADRIVGVESNGVATARNPRSSATGAGQFIDSTWLDMIRRYHPEFSGLPRGQQLGMRNDAALSKEMVGHYADENGAKLRSAGLPDNDGTRYLSHFAGPAGARSVLSADRATPVSQLLPASSIAANPFVRPMTAGQLADWAARKVGSSTPAMSTPGAPVGSGHFGFSGVEASLAPALPKVMPSVGSAARDDEPDVAKMLNNLMGSPALGRSALSALATPPAPASPGPANLALPMPGPGSSFDLAGFLALLNQGPAP